VVFLAGINVNYAYGLESSEGQATVIKKGSYSTGNATIIETLAYSIGEAIIRLVGGPWVPPVPPAPPSPVPPIAIRFPIERIVIALIIIVATLIVMGVSEKQHRKPKLKRSRKKWRKKIRQPLD